jgi:hypothetical protein
MAELAEVWSEALPVVRNGVTGVGIWTALNHSKPLAFEDGQFVLGLPENMADLAGHLRMAQTKKLVENEMSARLGAPVQLRVIDGTTQEAWERVKRRDLEAKRLQEAALNRARAELTARTNWDSVYEQLSRMYAAVQNKSLPQNRGKFYSEAIAVLGKARKEQENRDDMSERNFARCIERVAQYSEVPSTIVANDVLRLAGEI